MKWRLTIDVEAKSIEDGNDALNAAIRRVGQGITTGFDRNQESSFFFELEGEPGLEVSA